ncbi:MAG: ActR/PrrA/RegA family redox response regulator transcription factor [Pseudomonadota bacterium]
MGFVETAEAALPTIDPNGNTLLIVDDDAAFRNRLATTMARRGFEVTAVAGLGEARDAMGDQSFSYAVFDMRLEDGNGLDLVPEIRSLYPGVRVVILTGYGNIASAVLAVKTGAVDYLPKPADADDIMRALVQQGEKADPPIDPMSADRVRWEHIQRVYELCDRNVSETARRLKMHRRTLQRILAKRSPQ